MIVTASPRRAEYGRLPVHRSAEHCQASENNARAATGEMARVNQID
jgi:hypothetical protein